MKRLFLLLSVLSATVMPLLAQEEQGVPVDVFYLMPEFGKGTVSYQGQRPVQGTFNICAVDNTVRFHNAQGEEMAAEDNGLTRVVIDGVTFVRNDKRFLRLYPISGDVCVAVARDVTILTDSKNTAYGGQSQTTAVSEYTTMTAEGRIYNLEEYRSFPYRMSETASLFNGTSFVPLNKRNLQKCFPQGKDAIEEYFKSHRSVPVNDVQQVLDLCRSWAE